MDDNSKIAQLKRPQFIQLYKNLTDIYKKDGELSENDVSYRPIEQTENLILVLDYLDSRLRSELKEHSYLTSLLKNEFVELEMLENDKWISQVILNDFQPFIEYGFLVDKVSMTDMSEHFIQAVKDAFEDWIIKKIKLHQETQELLISLESETSLQELSCQCEKCTSLFRTKIREISYKKTIQLIDETVERLHDKVLFDKINNISSSVRSLKDQINSQLRKLRYTLRRSTVNKLDSDIKSYFKRQFQPRSELGRVYQEKVVAYLNLICEEEGVHQEILREEDYQRFIDNLDLDLWKAAGFIRTEFMRFINTLMSFKRKDISSTILKNYLGQFWLHSPARRKNRRIIYHMGPTNSGKTYHAIEALCKSNRGCYLAPLRLLAGELFDTMNDKGVVTTLLTGEEVIEKNGATHYSSTIEMAKLHQEFDCAVIDEIQMISDRQRGWAWTRALVNLDADEVHICGDGSVYDLVVEILKLTGDSLEVQRYERMTELKVENRKIEMKDLKRGDALIVFSRRNALRFKVALEQLNFKVSIIYGMLSPEVRREQARKFDSGETDIIVSTDAIAMGMNLPVQRIVFSTFSKFINSKEIPLTASEIKQIAGRAGRYLRFPTGYVTCLDDEKDANHLSILHEALGCELEPKTMAMVGPDLEIFKSVNAALEQNQLRTLELTEFLRLFNTMPFQKPFYCVQLKEMIEITEMVESVNKERNTLSNEEVFGFACAPVNLGLIEHVEYFMRVATRYVHQQAIYFEPIDTASHQIDYLETSIKCVELYQWLSRHFNGKYFEFDSHELNSNKLEAIEKLNLLLSEKTTKYQFRHNPLMNFRRRPRGAGAASRKDSRRRQGSQERSDRPPGRGGGKSNRTRRPRRGAKKSFKRR